MIKKYSNLLLFSHLAVFTMLFLFGKLGGADACLHGSTRAFNSFSDNTTVLFGRVVSFTAHMKAFHHLLLSVQVRPGGLVPRSDLYHIGREKSRTKKKNVWMRPQAAHGKAEYGAQWRIISKNSQKNN